MTAHPSRPIEIPEDSGVKTAIHCDDALPALGEGRENEHVCNCMKSNFIQRVKCNFHCEWLVKEGFCPNGYANPLRE